MILKYSHAAINNKAANIPVHITTPANNLQ